jgi:hypothetical protein
MSNPQEVRFIYSGGKPWDYDYLFSIFKNTIGAGLTLPESRQPGGGGG